MHFIWACALATLLAGCFGERISNPLKDPFICGRPQCDTEKGKFVYDPNIRYVYDYSAHVRNEFNGTGQNTSDIYITGTVYLVFPSKCEGILKLSDIELSERAQSGAEDYASGESLLHERSADFGFDLQKHDLRFSFHDGVIDELCPDAGDPNWVLNVKRGILSSFQNTMKRFDIDSKSWETDVSGSCDVNYVVQGASPTSKTSLLVKKTKDISSCIHRYKTNSILQTTPYDFRKQYSVWPILQSSSHCDITIDHHIYKDVVCQERHQFIPFSNNGTGAVTTSTISLKWMEEETYEKAPTSSYDDANAIKRREKLLFNHYPTPKHTTGEIKTARRLLQKMCNYGFPDIKRQFIDVFSKFLQNAKLLSSTALHQLFSRGSSICNNNDNGRNHILESLPYIGSTASVEMMTQEIIRKTVSDVIAQKWLASISFIPRPDEGMLQALYVMLKHEINNPEPIYIFSPSAVVHTFCRNHRDCGENEVVQNLVRLLEEQTKAVLAEDLTLRVKRERIIVLFRSIGNIGIMSKAFRYKMREIIYDDQIPVEIRVNAIAAHRRTECEKNREFFLDFYRNFTVNSELRIASYLEAMRCPDYLSVKHIKYVLKSEEVNQVGSFVWSHLKNLAKSASPIRVSAQSLLGDDDLGKKFKLDIRKFSHNFEQSLFFDEYNVGMNTDSNLIFGTDSYLPRAASLNFTVDLFGESINVFEVSAYMQGFEHIIEGIFGPNGPLSTKGFSDKVEAVRHYFKNKVAPLKAKYLDKLHMRLRRDADATDTEEYEFENEESDRPKEKRDAENYAVELQNDVKELNYDLKYNMDYPRASFGFKMFGNDMKYKTLEDLNEVYELLQNLNPTNQIKQLLSGKEIIYSKSGVFLEASYEVPLTSGFPMALQAYGASSIDLRMSGLLQGNSFWQNPRFAVKGKIKPSVSLDIIGSMQSDYFYGMSGIRVKSNLYSSSSIEANLTVDGKNFVSLQFGLPQDRNDIISARSELIVIKYEKEIRQNGIRKRYSNSTCTWPAVERAVGLKVCSDYSLPDVSKSKQELPSLLLCGPLDVDIHIDKSDVTAKIFSFEYKWIDTDNRSSASFIFETPNTQIPRIFIANLTKEPNVYDLSMKFENGKTMHSATATYKNTDDEKLVEAHLQIDGQKSFALELGMNKSMILNGWMFYPRFSLAVNNDEIAGLSGTVKKFGKNKIMQYDPNLEFETKKFKARVSGYITTTDIKFSTRLFVNYKFEDKPEQLIDFESELEGTSDGYKTSQVGMLKWNSTAYQKYNFKANVNYKRVLGHIDLGINVNNAVDFVDPRYNLGVRLSLIQTEPEDREFNSRTNFTIEVTRPISKIDYKFMLRYNSKIKRGQLHNVLLLLRYAEGKEATVIVSAMLPSALSRNIDVYTSISVPGFNACTARFQAIERTKRTQYDLKIEGTWFTGHSISIYGTYDDKSTSQESRHQLKLLVKSPHFNETTILGRYLRNETIMTIETNVEYGGDPYGLILRHNHVAMYDQSFYGELKVLDKYYWISARLSEDQFRKISIDLHIDKIREIRVIIGGQSTIFKKEIEAKISWDSNRDPTQELFFNADFNTPKHRMYDGGFTISYPQRTFSGSFDLAIPGPTYAGNLSLGWRSNETLHLSFDSGTYYEPTKHFWIDTRLKTPFAGWQNNLVQAQLYQSKNLFSTNATLLWAETQKLVLAVLTDYEFGEANTKCEAKLLVNSTVKDIPTIDASFKHVQSKRQYTTDIHIRHKQQDQKPNLFEVNSNWYVHFNELYRNVSGSINLQSPVNGYSKGSLATRFSLSSAKMLRGAADLELEDKKFTLSVDGKVRKLTDCMLVVNITTPILKYRNIVSRFGLVKQNRHFVAEVRAPGGALGVEVKFSVKSMNDFDVIFNLETPLEEFKKIMLIGKLQADTIDFRGGLNTHVLGYIGVSRKASIDDFEYSWRVYTPLKNFEESSLVAKFIRKEIFDMEVMLKFAQKKLGIIVNGRPKHKIIGLPRVQHSLPFKSKLSNDFDRFNPYFEVEEDSSEEESDEEEEEIEEDIESEWNLEGNMELSTIIWPTISGSLDIEDFDEEYYIVRSNLNLPAGTIELRDHLYFPDLMNIRNSLQIATPYQSIKEIELLYLHTAKFGRYYVSALELMYKNSSIWTQVGFNSNYTKLNDPDLKTHDIELNLFLPFESFPTVRLGGNVEIAETVYRANISGRTLNTFTSLAAAVETDTNYLDVTAGLVMASPRLPHYEFTVSFKRDLSESENVLNFGYEELYTDRSFARIETTWQSEGSQYLRMSSRAYTNVFPVIFVESIVVMNRTKNFNAEVDLTFDSLSRRGVSFHASAKKQAERINIELRTPLQNVANVTLNGMLRRLPQQDQFLMTGRLQRNHDIYNVNGTVGFYSNLPVHVDLRLRPVTRDSVARIEYSLQKNEGDVQKRVVFKVSEADTYFNVDGSMSIYSKVNWNVQTNVQASPGLISKKTTSAECSFNALAKTENDGTIFSELHLITPFRKYGIDAFNVNATANLAAKSGSMQTFFDFSMGNGRILFSWTAAVLENMQLLLDAKTQNEAGRRTLKVGMRYSNPGKSNQRLSFGGNLDVDSKMNLESNCSVVIISKQDMSGTFSIRLPDPTDETHHFSARYRGDVMAKPITDVVLETKYESDIERLRFVSRGQYRNVTDLQALLNAQWGIDTDFKVFETNLQMLRKGIRREVSAVVKTPYYEDEETISASGFYDKDNIYHVLNASLNYPESREIASTNIEFSSSSNVHGFISCATPFPNVTWLRTDLNYTTSGGFSRRYIKTAWPSDFAFVDMHSTFESHNLDRNHEGVINIEVPLETRHIASIDYDLKERNTNTDGRCKVTYNDANILNGKYKCKSVSRAGFTQDDIDISLDNIKYPIGVKYIHETEFTGPDPPLFDKKRAEIYTLKKGSENAWNITGELHVRTTETGQDYKIIAISPNRTVVLTSDYDYQDATVKQRSKVQLSSDVWIAYDFKLTNLTTQTNESQIVSVDLQYPKRNLSTAAWYAITDDAFDSDLTFKWTRAKAVSTENNEYDYDQSSNEDENEDEPRSEERVVKATLTWRNEPLMPGDKNNQTVLFVIKHPSFQKDVSFNANYYRSKVDILRGKLIIDYHESPEHLLTLEGGLLDSTVMLNHRNYSINLAGTHEVSEFYLKALASVGAKPGVYQTKNYGRYKRGFLPLAEGIFDAGIDLPQSEIHYHKVSPHKTFYVWGKSNGKYPVYSINGTYEDSPDINTTAEFYLNIDDRLIRLDANFTPDASQNLRMLGLIPDARGASFDLWRDYEDIRIVDVAYYLRMNHSRLVTSQLIWRPKLKEEIKTGINKLSAQMDRSFSENLDFWVKTLTQETSDASTEIWNSARPTVQDFLDDISGLTVIGEDLEEFRQLLNQSYEANDFYVKTMVNFTITVLDELAIRNHIGSLPKILSEIWQILGESGAALRKSILWLIETVKTTYKNTIDALNRILHGQAMNELSSLVEKAVYKYDRFIKDLHLSFIKYVQNIWNTISNAVMDYWRKMLERIQPMVMRFIHYAETMLWNISQEIFEFLHKHTNDLVKSPYFDTVSEFMRDFDTVYHDIKKNDAITNIKKYSSLASTFLREKYFKIVPFGKELQNLINEIIDEIKGLRKSELVRFLISRVESWQEKMTWFAEEFQLDRRIHQLWQIVLNKITSYEQTALQMDDKYREAKTKFIFDPNAGVMKLEQKLPMAWHAFNETPIFEEISELRMLGKAFRIFNGVNISITNYDIWQYYTNPYVWMPPFKSRALLIGSRHYRTFDKRFISLNHKYAFVENGEKPDQCSYLLANDFVDFNFTLMQEPSMAVVNDKLLATRKLAIVTDEGVIDIDMIGATVRINRNFTTALPIQIGKTTIYREWDILVIRSKNGFEINCNLQFDFCWFEASGWYFGKTAGIMGTMNNEIYDDFLTSSHVVSNDPNEFKQSWALNECKHEFDDKPEHTIPNELLNICDTYFRSKVSPFANCFATVDSIPYYEMCLDMGSNSITDFTQSEHPAQKGACAVALAYMESCNDENLPLRVPDICVHCHLNNGSYIAEGSLFEIVGDEIPKSTDVVFIVEAKSCNKDLTVHKNIPFVVSALEKAFGDVGLQNTRYAVIAYGGEEPFDRAYSIVYNNDIFTDSSHIHHHFEHIKTGNGNSTDISRAIKVATDLVFRPGASKTFILMPCSNCNVTSMHFDYSSVLQFLWEHNINLHIFMNGDFETKKPRNEHKIFGFDRAHAFTNNYLKDGVGNKELYSEIIMPKNHLGLCMTWAMETNGTIFTANKLKTNSRTPIKKFSAIFAKRVAKSSIPSSCQSCECTGENNGIAYVTCSSCDLQNDFEEEDMNTIFNDYIETDSSES